jgi:hypothetical protein
MAKTIVEGTCGGVGARPGWTPRWATSAGHGGGGGAARGGGRITRCGRIRSGWCLGERHRQVTAAVEGTDGRGGVPRGAAAESPDAGGSARGGASVGHSGRGNRRGRWSTVRWRRWNRVGRLSNPRMWEDPLRMFRVTIIG